jgi:hypothetical protein
MALPFLPADDIPTEFVKLRESAGGALADLFTYVEENWIEEQRLWAPATWSIFGRSIRTNNDVEGWHRRLNHNAKKGHLPFYLMITLLHQESQAVDLYVHVVSQGKLSRHQRKTYKHMQARIFESWNKFTAGDLSATHLLEQCLHLIAF